MSRIYFHSPSQAAAEVRGSERAYMGVLIGDLALAVIRPSDWGTPERLKALMGKHYLNDAAPDQFFAKSWATAFTVSGDGLIVIDGKPIDTWTLQLNTALVLGGDPLKLLARIHAQCEIHAYVEGPNRAWLAGIIAQGVTSGLYRKNKGWDAAQALLVERSDEPVVMSYSVCEGFPNSGVSDWMPPWPEGVSEEWNALTPEQQRAREEKSEAWYELPKDEQWSRSLSALRSNGGGLELMPDNWADFHFGERFTAFDLVGHVHSVR